MFDDGCLVATPWGSDIVHPPGEIEPPPEVHQLRQSLLRRAAGVTACCRSFAANVAAYAALNCDEVHITPWAVDLARFKYAPRTIRGDSPPRIGFYKGFRGVYDPCCLMRAAPKILRRLPAVRFHMVGDGPLLAECQDMARACGVEDSFDWIGYQPLDHIPAFLANCDVTVVCSACESLGVAALESSAMGVPVAASDISGLRETVRHNETGLHFTVGSSDALADTVLDLLADPERRQRFSEAGRRFVAENYDWTKCVHQWIAAYEASLDAVCHVV
jgi:glycosyltransferase involved in cell wall biosynthesis